MRGLDSLEYVPLSNVVVDSARDGVVKLIISASGV